MQTPLPDAPSWRLLTVKCKQYCSDAARSCSSLLSHLRSKPKEGSSAAPQESSPLVPEAKLEGGGHIWSPVWNLTQLSMRQAMVLILCLVVTRSLSPITRQLSLDGGRYPYDINSVLLVAEMFKLLISAVALAVQVYSAHPHDQEELIDIQTADLVHFAIPAFFFVWANFLIFVASIYIDAAVFQPLTNLKIITTAFLVEVFLKRHISGMQWFALGLLFFSGVISTPDIRQDIWKPSNLWTSKAAVGFLAMVFQNATSSFANVYTEAVFKRTKKLSIWLQNVILYSFMILMLSMYLVLFDTQVYSNGLFHGWNLYTWLAMWTFVAFGLSCAFVFKYLDNILYLFAGSSSVFVTAAISSVTFNFHVDALFLIALLMLKVATFLYYHEYVMSRLNEMRGHQEGHH